MATANSIRAKLVDLVAEVRTAEKAPAGTFKASDIAALKADLMTGLAAVSNFAATANTGSAPQHSHTATTPAGRALASAIKNTLRNFRG